MPTITWTTKQDLTTGHLSNGTRAATIELLPGGRCVMSVRTPWSEECMQFRFSSVRAAKEWAEPTVTAWFGKTEGKLNS